MFHRVDSSKVKLVSRVRFIIERNVLPITKHPPTEMAMNRIEADCSTTKIEWKEINKMSHEPFVSLNYLFALVLEHPQCTAKRKIKWKNNEKTDNTTQNALCVRSEREKPINWFRIKQTVRLVRQWQNRKRFDVNTPSLSTNLSKCQTEKAKQRPIGNLSSQQQRQQ